MPDSGKPNWGDLGSVPANPDSIALKDPAGDSYSQILLEFELYKRLNAANDIKEFSDIIWNIARELGFSDYTFTHTEAGIHTGLITLSPKLLSDYKNGGFYENDLVREYTRNPKNVGKPIFNSVIQEYVRQAPFENDTVDQNREMFRLLSNYGYHDTYIILAKSVTGSGNCVLTFETKGQKVSDFKRNVEEKKWLLDILPEIIEYTACRKFSSSFWEKEKGRKIGINPKPLAILAALGKGDLTLNEAADKLDISIHTANQHVAAARRAFCAKTTTGAVYQAAKAGLIDL